MRLVLASLLVAAAALAACSEEGATRRPRTGALTDENGNDLNDPRTTAKENHPDPLEGLPKGETQMKSLCDRAGAMSASNGNFNAVTNAFCGGGVRPKSIDELLAAVGLTFQERGPNGTNGSNDNPGFAMLGHSSSIVARSVSAVNPRAIVFSPPPGTPTRIPGYVVTGFARGEPFVEIAAEQANGGKLTFYLVKFDLACGEDCTPKDLLTPAIESGWKGVTVYDDEDLKNTVMDCRHCHQPDGPESPAFLRMQELEDPWTHWFRSDRPGGLALLQDYLRAHGEDEDYGGIPGALIPKADGRALEDLVKGQGFGGQPNGFDSASIEREITRSSKLQPLINNPAGQSSTWEALYARSAAGQFIPVPYHDVKVTDPDKLQFVTDAYRAWRADASQNLPDIRRVFLEDALADMSIIPKVGATGEEVLTQSCAQCHNGKLDQTISRAKFDVTKLSSMSAAEKAEAIKRIELPSTDRLHMPPSFMRTLPDDAKAAAIAALK